MINYAQQSYLPQQKPAFMPSPYGSFNGMTAQHPSTTNIYNNYFYQPATNQNNFFTQQMMPQNNFISQPVMSQNPFISQPMMPQNNFFAPVTSVPFNNVMTAPFMAQQPMQMFPPIPMPRPMPRPQFPPINNLMPLLMNLMQMMTGGMRPVVQEEVTVSDNAHVWGDPHYHLVGKNGKKIHFDHKGKAGNTYNVFKGDNLQIDGLYAPHGDDPCIIDKTTVRAGSDVITFSKEGKATLNGRDLTQGSGTLKDGTKYTLKGKLLSVTPSDGTGKVNIQAKGDEMVVDPDGKFKGIGGIIGTAIDENRALSEEEGNKFDVSKEYDKNGNLLQKQT